MDFAMHIAQPGLDIIKSFEGLELKAYRCPAGKWTIGYGHTYAAGEPYVRPGMVITKEEAEQILKNDLGQFEDAVLAVLKRKPSQNQFDAMVSLCLNIGETNWREDCSIWKKLNKGDIQAAADTFPQWNKSKGKVLPGLVRRRKAERALFLKGETLSFTVALNIERWRRWIAA